MSTLLLYLEQSSSGRRDRALTRKEFYKGTSSATHHFRGSHLLVLPRVRGRPIPSFAPKLQCAGWYVHAVANSCSPMREKTPYTQLFLLLNPET